jgi:hypothetical protein
MGGATLRGRRYVLLDASVVIDYFISDPLKVRSSGRINTIVESVRKRAVDEVVLLIPNVCIPEVFGAFAKHALSTWNRQSLKLDRRRYRTLQDAFRRYLHNGAVFQQYELTRYHVLATDLIAPVDHWYRLQHRNAKPMGAIDHLVLAMGVSLCRLNGHDAVAILTSDARMSRAVRRAKSLSASQTAALNLLGRASELGYRWRPEIYPRVIDLQRMPDLALRDLFGAWPLLTRSPHGIEPRARGIR